MHTTLLAAAAVDFLSLARILEDNNIFLVHPQRLFFALLMKYTASLNVCTSSIVLPQKPSPV
jgi:hypothetical protein